MTDSINATNPPEQPHGAAIEEPKGLEPSPAKPAKPTKAALPARREPGVYRHAYEDDAAMLARFFLERERIKPGVLYWQNAFNFSSGRVPKDIREGFDLSEFVTWSDVGEAIERRMKAQEKPAPRVIRSNR